MIDVLLQTLPFFALIGCGYGAAATGFFSERATETLTKFVFYFALSAMLFNFSANIDLGTLFDWNFALAYLAGCFLIYIFVTIIAILRGTGWSVSAVEAQCAVIGNNGFLAVPMVLLLIGPEAVPPAIFVLSIDLLVFGTLIVVSITAAQQGGITAAAFTNVGQSVLQNPMVMSMALGLLWGAVGLPIAGPLENFLDLLGSAATPCALFAIGASLASKSTDRLAIAGWLSFAKLFLHPLAVAVFALWVFEVDRFAAGIMIIMAAMPTAGNIYILAQHFGVAPQRVSATILISTVGSVITLSLVIALVLSRL